MRSDVRTLLALEDGRYFEGESFGATGTRVGEIFANSDALDAYSVDLAGSFCGVVAMAVAAAAQTPPPVWFALGGIPLAWLSRRWTGWAPAMPWWSAGMRGSTN